MSPAPEQLLVGFQLSPQQKRVWLLQPGGRAFRAQLAVELEGELRADWLDNSLRRIVGRHETLRTSFRRQLGMKVPVQAVAEEAEYVWREVDLSGVPAEANRACRRGARARRTRGRSRGAAAPRGAAQALRMAARPAPDPARALRRRGVPQETSSAS